MGTDYIVKILKELSQKRPVFHSEADFQHALAWEIHNSFNQISIRLEKPMLKNMHLDIWVKTKIIYGIELKYKTKGCKYKVKGESFVLSNQAESGGYYDFMKDIGRLECFVKTKQINKGWAIFLTNNQSFWLQGRDKSNYQQFKIYDGRNINNEKLEWNRIRNDFGKKSQPINIGGCYTFKWRNYSPENKNNAFKYLLVEVS